MKRTAEVALDSLWRSIASEKKMYHVRKGAYYVVMMEKRNLKRKDQVEQEKEVWRGVVWAVGV